MTISNFNLILCLVYLSAFRIFLVRGDEFFVTYPAKNTVWQAGKPANVTWRPKDAKSITVELIPSTDLVPRVVALLAQNVPGTVNQISFIVPDVVPTWVFFTCFTCSLLF
jgi:hypothetical protein